MRISDFIVCDDLRRELFNKVSLMGVYSDEIRVSVPDPTQPFALRLATYIRVLLDRGDQLPDMINVVFRLNETTVLEQPIRVSVVGPNGFTVGLSIAQLVLNGFGSLTVEGSFQLNNAPLGEPFQHVLRIVHDAELAASGSPRD